MKKLPPLAPPYTGGETSARNCYNVTCSVFFPLKRGRQLEIPIDVAFALLLLWMCGHTLNLMSAIGLIVTCGIIINDSILKLDAINELRKTGMPLLEAIHEAGRRRLRPIIMTSLTTIFAMVPLLFSFDMGSELQKPLSIAMIGAMFVGTLVSLFIIPLIYWFIYRKERA